MVAGAQQQPQAQQQQPPLSAEEEALKRNTDCVYFLASPLTCKKGVECEYRHSEYARVNPRDCWYWLNGNCLNPKCAFRHPPLDGLLGTQAAPSAGSALPSSQATAVSVTTAASVPPATNSSSKQAVPCIFFQKGYCLKGDRCAFSHGPNPTTSTKVLQASAVTHGSEPSNVKKAFGGLQKCTQEQMFPLASISKPVGVAPEANHIPKVENAPPRNGVSIERSVPSSKSFDNEALRSKAVSAPIMNGISMTRSNRSYQVNVSDDHGFQNGKDADEFLRESSPGFDVLVDDELRDPDYFHGEDQYGRARGLDGRNLSSVDEYDMDQSAGYGSAADIDRERFRDPHGYDSYDHMQGQYAWEQHRASSERTVGGAAHIERTGYRKSHSPDNIDESDLRHRLSKQRRVNGLRSVISHEHAHDTHVDERNYRGSRRDSHQMPQQEGPLSSRLRGRIRLPGGSSVNGGDLRHDREFDRGRSRGRLSPSRPQSSIHQGRLRDRLKGKVQEDYNSEGRILKGKVQEDYNSEGRILKGKVQEDYNSEGRIFRGFRPGREAADEGTDFAAPKSLSELKVGGKVTENKEHSHLGKRKSMRMEVSQPSEGDLSFEGPKPLSEILKRKREAEAAGSGNAKSISEARHVSSSLAKEEGNSSVFSSKEESKSATIDVVGTEDEKIEGPDSHAPDANDLEVEDGMIYDETVDDQELEAEDQTHGEYDFEQGEEGEYDGENAEEGEEEFLEDEDGDDDFAKKIGVMFS